MIPTNTDILSLIMEANLIMKAVLLLLVGFSVVSWAVIFYKWKQFRQADQDNRKFIEVFSLAEGQTVQQAAERHAHSPMAAVWLEAMARRQPAARPSTVAELSNGHRPMESRFRRASELELSRFDVYLPFLATTGNVTPFIGLFGTVLGIIDAFQSIGQMGTASIAAVAPGIAEALVATAAGLFAAIPAVMAYNYFLNRLRLLSIQLDLFSSDAVDRAMQTAPPPVTAKA